MQGYKYIIVPKAISVGGIDVHFHEAVRFVVRNQKAFSASVQAATVGVRLSGDVERVAAGDAWRVHSDEYPMLRAAFEKPDHGCYAQLERRDDNGNTVAVIQIHLMDTLSFWTAIDEATDEEPKFKDGEPKAAE